MMLSEWVKATDNRAVMCAACDRRLAVLVMEGYADGSALIRLCPACATQLARKLLEDLCEGCYGDRHG